MRTRTVTTKAEYGGKACVGCATDSRACNAEPCAGKLLLLNIPGIENL